MGEPRIEIVTELPSGIGRSIAERERLTEQIERRADDIRAAIRAATEIVADAAPAPNGPFQLSTIEVTFGITLTAEAGVIVSKASAEASLEVTISIERESA